MQELNYFYLETCPYCRQANMWLDELMQEESGFAGIPIRRIEEAREAKLAESYDYYYVPCFFLGDKKLHEGAATKEKIRQVLKDFISIQG